MKASLLLFLWLSLPFHNSSCSRAAGENNAATNSSNDPPAIENPNAGNVSDQSPQRVESSPSPKQKDVVVFDGKNYIRKKGWKVPPRADLYKDESYDRQFEQFTANNGREARTTTNGTKVFTTTSHYIYKTPWLYSQDFYFEGRGLESIKGQLESVSFLEMSVNGNVFFYSIFTRKVVSPPPSNNDPHEDPFRYKIMDADGDGIFETLLGVYDEIVVPDWVLK